MTSFARPVGVVTGGAGDGAVGSCHFDLRSGWVFDDELLRLWGVDRAVDLLGVIDELVVREDRVAVFEAWSAVLDHGGRCHPQYRIRHGKSAELRSLMSTCDAVVDVEGRLIWAIATHIDMSVAIATRAVVDFEAPAFEDRSVRHGDRHPVELPVGAVGSGPAESRLREAGGEERFERRAVADRLLELTYEQRELLEQLANTETRERALLAEAVHDDPMQLIVAAILRIDNVRMMLPGEPGDELDRVANLLETSVERLRKIIVAITPPDLSEGLGIALRNLADGLFIGTTSVVTVLGPTHVRLSPPATATAYRIMREALVNARKHSQASTITLRLAEHDSKVMLTLTDDGVGAESLRAEAGHLGVATMRARAGAEDAQLHLDSALGLGTTVALTLPIADGAVR